ncbi:hypothetical protein DCS_02700 [Drechmeria coniospora]|uniref:Uncharacterized protein n=1 Tax=Drechmeria coniospora TaxID=98403 RepID=A0A151GWT2_DRECN|nr:hypothetical protein DCS_02700 [Drechmeria coniospora]KYK61558.1 hypothetical protein DCS_02700 [Drechmeria coniospora]
MVYHLAVFSVSNIYFDSRVGLLLSFDEIGEFGDKSHRDIYDRCHWVVRDILARWARGAHVAERNGSDISILSRHCRSRLRFPCLVSRVAAQEKEEEEEQRRNRKGNQVAAKYNDYG